MAKQYTDDELFTMSDEEFEQVLAEDASGVDEFIDDSTDTEQPDGVQDSDNNADYETDITDDSDSRSTDDIEDNPAEEGSDVSEDHPTETETDDVDEQTEESTDINEETTAAENTKSDKKVFRANGVDYEFTPEEIMEKFPIVFAQAMDYTKKTQRIKPYSKTIDAIEQAGLTHDDINLAIDVLKGDKDALTEVLKRTGVDALDLDPDNSKYTPNDYGRDEHTQALEETIKQISLDPEYSVTQRVLTQDWDETSFNTVTQDPNMLRGLHIDVKTGTYAKLLPVAEKLKVYDNGRKPFIEYYKEAASKVLNNTAKDVHVNTTQKAPVQRTAVVNKSKAQARIKAAPTRKAVTNSNNSSNNGFDYINGSDEEFEKWYNNIRKNS